MAGSRRTERVSKELLRLMGGFLLELRDDRLAAAMVTPTRARISADMSILDVWISVNGPEALQLEMLEVLSRARPFLRRRLGEEGGLRITPQLRFFRDEVPDHAARIAALLEEAHRIQAPAVGGDAADDDDAELTPAHAGDADAEDDVVDPRPDPDAVDAGRPSPRRRVLPDAADDDPEELPPGAERRRDG